MKAKFGAIIVAGSGKLGGHVAYTDRAGSHLRIKVTPIKRQTPRHTVVSQMFRHFAHAWQLLSEPQRAAWNAAVSAFAGTDIFGDLKVPSGFNLFQRLNSNLAQIGLGPLTIPPLPGLMVPVTIVEFLVFLNPQTMSLSYKPSTGINTAMEVWATAPMSAGISYVKGEFRLLLYQNGEIPSPLNLSANYIARFGSIGQVGQKICVKIESVNKTTGQINIDSHLCSIVTSGTSADFLALNQTSRLWIGMAAAPNGNVYACAANGDIYVQTNSNGNFNALNQTVRQWYGMAAAPNGNAYASVWNGDIYMQTNGIGDFMALNQAVRQWYGMAAAPNGNVYACVYTGDIYMQTNGIGDFMALNQTARNWRNIAAAPNGNIYASVKEGDIYMQTNGIGDFIALNQTERHWLGIAAAPNGNIYANVFSGDIYMQNNGTGDFIALSQTLRDWTAMAAAPNGNIYASVNSGDIYMQTNT